MENNIKLLRMEKNLKQSQLGDLVGISQQTVSRIEKDSASMSVDTLVRLAAYFGVTCDYLLGISEKRRGSDSLIRNSKDSDHFYELYYIYKRLSKRDQELLYRFGKSMGEVKK